MKKTLTTMITALMMATAIVRAVPAYKGLTTLTQPDGTTVTIALHGDEYLHWNTTADGYSVVKDGAGYWTYALLTDGQLLPTSIKAHDIALRTDEERRFLSSQPKNLVPEMTATNHYMKQEERKLQARARQQRAQRAPQYDYTRFKGLIILVAFNDRSFSRTDYATLIDNMVNKENFRGYEDLQWGNIDCTGSVRDYFSDQSMGLFKPQFDIVGPVTIDKSQYDAQGTQNVGAITQAAINAADPLVDFSQYDRDGDGAVDMIYFVFAGLGSHISGNDSRLVWPHASYLSENNYYMIRDEVVLFRYACSTELLGSANFYMIDGIGTMCHEFSHVLGLPDLYDTDYSESGGESNHPAEWSLMSGGSYLNNGNTPCGYSLYERYAAGFATPTLISTEGNYTLIDLATSNSGYRINSLTHNEYFLLENRQQTKWDSYLPGCGMLVHRVDSTNRQVWEWNSVNANPKHNYYTLLRAGNGKGATKNDPFPGALKRTELNNTTIPSMRSWNGNETPLVLTGIDDSGSGIVRFEVVESVIDKTNWEDFEQMALTEASSDTVTVEGKQFEWILSKGAHIVAPQQGQCSDKQALAMVRNAQAMFRTTKPLQEITFTLYNPTSTRAMIYFHTSEDGQNWKQTYVTNTEVGSGIVGGTTAIMTFTPQCTKPGYVRLWLRIGSTTEEIYLDDLRFTFDEDYVEDVPDAIMTTPFSAITHADTPCYNLKGQRVNAQTKGIIISQGRKYINK